MSSSPSQSAATAAAAAGAAPASPSRGKICFNTLCKEQITDGSSPRRRGWRLRSGEHVELCARCGYAFEQGSFCETFHSDGDGWRKCESCGKRVHCGCIVSIATFMLLDAGGIECISCARKNLIAAPNHVSQSSLIFTLGSERLKDSSTKNWAQLNSSSPVPGQWRQASNMWKTFTQSDLQQRLSYEFDRPNGVDRMMSGQRLPIPHHNKKKAEDPSMNRVQIDGHINMNSSYGSPSVFNELHRDERCAVGLEETAVPNSFGGSPGISFGSLSNLVPSTVKEETPVHLVGLVSSPPSDCNNNVARIRQTSAPQVAKQGFHSVADLSGEAQGKNARSRVEGRCRNQLLPRYWPRITDQELQQISGDSNSVVTPLFEKMLSASDAGRIGRLVLPKKCAEAYFPTISQPEGLPLKVQDANGQEWVFQFRFWPNNNSRMYVLEGVTPCIQSMKLQAGDTVTFSRMDPEGKLVMGFRKASNISNDPDNQAVKGGNTYPLTKEVNQRNGSKSGEAISAIHSRSSKGAYSGSKNTSKVDKLGLIPNEKIPSKIYALPSKRKGTAPGSKNKRLRIENEDSIELKLTWEEAQELLHPPPNHKPSIVVIEGHEFEEYEIAPILGKPAAFATNEAGYSALNTQEATSSQPPYLIPSNDARKNKGKSEMEAAEGLDALANLAILGEDPPSSSSPSSLHHIYHHDPHHHHHHHDLDHHHLDNPAEQQAAPPTTRHPRHRPGCSCIVCIQPPSGKGPKHKPSCQCNVCLTVKRRFRTLMLRKEKRQSERDGGGAVVEKAPVAGVTVLLGDEEEGRKATPSPMKTPQIDLNIQPDREEEPSPVSDAGNLMRLLQDAAA